MILVPFVISFVYWSISFAEQIIRLKMYFVNRTHRYDSTIVGYSTIFNAVVLLNVGPHLYPTLPLKPPLKPTYTLVRIRRYRSGVEGIYAVQD